MKKYKSGFFGGKFMPLHKGHLHCINQMATECEIGYLVLFINGLDEQRILMELNDEYLKPQARFESIKRCAAQYDNIIPVVIDVKNTVHNGIEDWDQQTPLVLNAIGQVEAVYGSEPSYSTYFKRAYPWSEYRVVDAARNEIPISGTKCRAMSENEREKWIV